MSGCRFLTLPPEILIEILCYLDVINNFACRKTCRTLSNVISNSVKLQFVCKMEIAGLQDNPYCTLSILDRLAALESREISWSYANWMFFTDIDVPSRWSGVYDLTPSVYLLGKSPPDNGCIFTTGVQTIRLPHKDQETTLVEWTEFNFGMDIIDFGSAIEEHDLLACISSVRDENNIEMRHIVVVLFRHSTQKLHDGCENPVIYVCRTRLNEGLPNISIQIAGENLAVIVIFNRVTTTRHDFLYVFNWKSGKAKSSPLPVNNIGITFLHEDILLNPNVIRKSLDIYHISSSASSAPSVYLIQSFLLPSVARGWRITRVSCRADPNPTSDDAFPKYTRTSRPFSNDPPCAIIIFNLRIQLVSDIHTHDFVMYVHRKALLDLLPSYCRHLSPTLDSKGNLIVAGRSEQASLPGPMVPWKSWGPSNTRWFNADDLSTVFITTTAGQRCVQFLPSFRDSHPAGTIIILDFNPWHVKLAYHDKQHGVLIGKGKDVFRQSMGYELDENLCPGLGAFEESHIVGRLPFVAHKLAEKWDYDAVLLDEERILGIRTGDEPHQTASLDVMYIG